MHHRLIAIFVLFCIALGGSGCAFKSKSKSKRYKEVLLPKQTGSALQRRIYVETTGDEKKKQPEKKKTPKPDPEREETPPADEEEAPPPERFR